MKQFITLISALLLLHSCRTIQERSEAVQRHLAIENKHSTIQWNHYDSTGRYWHFQSDSPFYYHPDNGLYGRGGLLLVEEHLLNNTLWQSHSDSVRYQLEERSEESYRSEAAPYRNVWWYAIGIGIILGLVGAYRCWAERR